MLLEQQQQQQQQKQAGHEGGVVVRAQDGETEGSGLIPLQRKRSRGSTGNAAATTRLQPGMYASFEEAIEASGMHGGERGGGVWVWVRGEGAPSASCVFEGGHAHGYMHQTIPFPCNI